MFSTYVISDPSLHGRRINIPRPRSRAGVFTPETHSSQKAQLHKLHVKDFLLFTNNIPRSQSNSQDI